MVSTLTGWRLEVDGQADRLHSRGIRGVCQLSLYMLQGYLVRHLKLVEIHFAKWIELEAGHPGFQRYCSLPAYPAVGKKSAPVDLHFAPRRAAFQAFPFASGGDREGLSRASQNQRDSIKGVPFTKLFRDFLRLFL